MPPKKKEKTVTSSSSKKKQTTTTNTSNNSSTNRKHKQQKRPAEEEEHLHPPEDDDNIIDDDEGGDEEIVIGEQSLLSVGSSGAAGNTTKKNKESTKNSNNGSEKLDPSRKKTKPNDSCAATTSNSTSKINKEIQSSEMDTTSNGDQQGSTTTSVSSTLNAYKIVDAHTGKKKTIGPKNKITSLNQLRHAICEVFKLKSVNDIESIRNLDDKDITDADLQMASSSLDAKSNKNGLNDSTIVVIDDTNQNSYSTKNLPPTSTHGYFILTLKSNAVSESSSKVKANLQLTVDIVPHVNILIHGGDEYDFITALAEVIDNSIQNTVLNKNDRIIDIRFEKPSQNNEFKSKLHIWDNGRGMNFKTLVNWATLGITDAPVDDAASMAAKSKSDLSRRRIFDKFITSDFSRYGVGSKKAIFNLGDQVTLVSKPKDSRFVYEVTLSRQKLEEDFGSGKDKQWKADCISRPPSDTEKQWDSFTHFTISDIKKVYVDRYDASIIKKRLGHIYHYYIYGTDGNKESQDIIEDDDEYSDTQDELEEETVPASDDEDEEPKKTSKSSSQGSSTSSSQKRSSKKALSDEEDFVHFRKPKNVIIKVDGIPITSEDQDLESLYLQEGKSPFSFEIKLSVKNSDSSSTGMELSMPTQSSGVSIVNSTVRGIIYYYPFKQGRETLPIPEDLYLEGGKYMPTDQEVPLSERNPGFECFWNGRLLANEKIKNLPWMEKERSNRDIPDNCYRRVKGMLFFDCAFEVSANKMYLCKQTPLCQALMNYTDRTLVQRYRKWMKECHKKLDEEIIFDECDLERTQKEGKGLKTFYKRIKYGQTSYTVGDYVVMKTRPKIIGTLVDMFRDLTSEEYTVTAVVKEWSPESLNDDTHKITGQCFPISKIQSVLTKQEFKSEISKLKNKLPSYIEVVDTPSVSARERRPPPDPVTAGYVLKYISASIMTGDHKVVTTQLFPITLTIRYEGDNEQEQKFEASVTSTKPFKKGVHCFKPNKLKSEFNVAGTYLLELSSTEDSGIKSKVVKLDVVPAGPTALNICSEIPTVSKLFSVLKVDKKLAEDAIVFFLNKEIPPIVIEQLDPYGNFVPFAISGNLLNEQLKITTSDDSIVLSSYEASFTNDRRLQISDLRITSAHLGNAKFLNTKLLISFGILSVLELNIFILAGQVFSIQLSEDSNSTLKNNSVKKMLPDIEAKLLDEMGNCVFIKPVYDEEEDNDEAENFSPILKGDALKEEIRGILNAETGHFVFKGATLHSDSNSSQRKETEIILRCNKISITIPLTIEAISTIKPSTFSLSPPDTDKHMVKDRQPLKVNVQAIVGTELVGWKLELGNEMYERMAFDGYARTSWSSANLLPVENGICFLPTLVVPQSAKTSKYTIDILSKSSRNEDLMQDDDGDHDINPEFIIANFTIHLRSVNGPPCIFKIDRKKSVLGAIKCEQPFSIKCSIMDAYGNTLDPQEDKEIYPELEHIDAAIEIVSQLNGESEKIEITSPEKMKKVTTKNGYLKFSNISLIGPTGEFHIKVIDRSGKIKEDKIEHVMLEPGPPHSIRINETIGEVIFDVENLGLTPPFFVTCHDKFGNKYLTHGSYEIDTPETGIDIRQYEGEMNQSIDLQIDEGRAYMPQFWINGVEGLHPFSIEYENPKVERACFKINVKKGSHPTSLKILNKVNQLKAGDFMEAFEVAVIGENGKPVKAPSQLHLNVVDPQGSDKRHFVSNISTNDLSYTFANSERVFTKAGVYRYKITLDVSNLSNVAPLGLPKSITESFDLIVAPDEPAALEIENDTFQLPVVTNCAEDIDRRSFWEELSLKVVDKHSNTVIADDKIKKVIISVERSEESMDSELPELEGSLEAKFENGRAKFSRLSIKEGSGETGFFKLVFTAKHLPPKELDFAFTDNSKVQEEEKELQQKRLTLLSELDYLKQEIKKAQENHQENEYKLSNFRSTQHELLKTIKEFELSFENDVPNLENTEKMLTLLKKKMEIKAQNNRKTRECNVGLSENKALQKIKQLQKESDSGIVGILGELGYIDNEKQNDTISRTIADKMQCIVVQNQESMDKVRKALDAFPNKLPILPLDNIFKCPKGLDNNGKLRLDPIGDNIDGFIGYAVNLIELDPRKEMLRHAFWNILGQTLVFESFEKGLQFRKKRLESNTNTPIIICLDGERIESTGIVYGGAKSNAPPVFRFGQTPISENPEMKLLLEKKKKVEEFKKILKETIAFEKGEYKQSEQTRDEIISKHTPEIEHIEEELATVEEELRNIRQGLVLSKKKKTPSDKKTSKQKKEGTSKSTEKTTQKKKPTSAPVSEPSSPILFSQSQRSTIMRDDDPMLDEIEEFSESDRDEIEEFSSDQENSPKQPKKSAKAKKVTPSSQKKKKK
ncbi:hypothetical protein C9374_010686 [Naegleria lovaniensis]|uniref:SMC hinge domain-containing protein n=1 Tax=Naegleria lovaniensis TaxID=51637 RepID=A0AA88GFI9_NAELO|nr:uncharacterized protein C9374_010686 [Naegleria lovaniensis]KAG2374667.1 hypothetical protein C9374_010686 [Naegleria lovaniensis]